MRNLFAPRRVALFEHLFFALVVCALVMAFTSTGSAQVTIAQISDTHLGEAHSPHAAENLRRTVEMVNARHPDAVVLSGDIGENPQEWERARQILKGLRAPLYYAPGNHDVHSNDVERYRAVFGPDYYRFQVKGVTFLVIDSQLLGNFDQFEAQSPQPLPPEVQRESEKMLSWLGHQAAGRAPDDQQHHWWNKGKDDRRHDDTPKDDDRRPSDDHGDHRGGIVIGIQHIAAFRGDNLPPDPKPYWTINEPYRSREMGLLHRLGIKHMLVGHWHVGHVFERDGITWHVAPSTGRLLPWSGQLGFAMHSIARDGDVKTEFVSLGTEP
jgi:3',5'-cyclic AMP phosphodiesterase CpdA